MNYEKTNKMRKINNHETQLMNEQYLNTKETLDTLLTLNNNYTKQN